MAVLFPPANIVNLIVRDPELNRTEHRPKSLADTRVSVRPSLGLRLPGAVGIGSSLYDHDWLATFSGNGPQASVRSPLLRTARWLDSGKDDPFSIGREAGLVGPHVWCFVEG